MTLFITIVGTREPCEWVQTCLPELFTVRGHWKERGEFGDFGFCCSEDVSMEMLGATNGWWSKHIKIKLILLILVKGISADKLEFYQKEGVAWSPFRITCVCLVATRIQREKDGDGITPFLGGGDKTRGICPSATGRCESPPTRVWRSSFAWRRSWVEGCLGGSSQDKDSKWLMTMVTWWSF